jgi:hypothetical protein
MFEQNDRKQLERRWQAAAQYVLREAAADLLCTGGRLLDRPRHQSDKPQQSEAAAVTPLSDGLSRRAAREF